MKIFATRWTQGLRFAWRMDKWMSICPAFNPWYLGYSDLYCRIGNVTES